MKAYYIDGDSTNYMLLKTDKAVYCMTFWDMDFIIKEYHFVENAVIKLADDFDEDSVSDDPGPYDWHVVDESKFYDGIERPEEFGRCVFVYDTETERFYYFSGNDQVDRIVEIMRHSDSFDVRNDIAKIIGVDELTKDQEMAYIAARKDLSELLNKDMDEDEYIYECDKIAEELAKELLEE